MQVSHDTILGLNNRCGLPHEKCRAALEQHRGDVDAALAALIDNGRVKEEDLNPDTVADEFFARAVRHVKLQLYRSCAKGDVSAAALEQQIAEDDAKEAARLKTLYEQPAFAGRTPPTPVEQ